MKQSSIALQLYSVRDALGQDFEGTVRQLATYGYRAVEAAGQFGAGVQSAKALFDELGMRVPSLHSPAPVGDQKAQILETAAALECQYLICPYLPPDQYFSDLDGVKRACDLLNEGNAAARAAGLTFGYHNHWFEMAVIAGKPAYQHMLDRLDASIVFELDTYWVQVGGLKTLDVMQDLHGRLPLLHIKDGPADAITSDMVAVGRGVIDVPAILNASSAEWHVVELDRCATDMLTAVQQSYAYLQGLSR